VPDAPSRMHHRAEDRSCTAGRLVVRRYSDGNLLPGSGARKERERGRTNTPSFFPLLACPASWGGRPIARAGRGRRRASDRVGRNAGSDKGPRALSHQRTHPRWRNALPSSPQLDPGELTERDGATGISPLLRWSEQSGRTGSGDPPGKPPGFTVVPQNQTPGTAKAVLFLFHPLSLSLPSPSFLSLLSLSSSPSAPIPHFPSGGRWK